MTGKKNRGRTADAPVFSHFLTAAGREKAFRRNAQPQNEILCSKGAWGIPNKQRQEPDGYPGALLATFLVIQKQPARETSKFHSLAYSFSSFLEISFSSSANPRVWLNKVSRISGGQFR